MWRDKMFRMVSYSLILHLVSFGLLILTAIAIIVGNPQWKHCVILSFIFWKISFATYKKFQIMKAEEILQYYYNCPLDELEKLVGTYYEKARKENDPQEKQEWLRFRAMLWKILQERLEREVNL